jgi:hypothetical protein
MNKSAAKTCGSRAFSVLAPPSRYRFPVVHAVTALLKAITAALRERRHTEAPRHRDENV